MEVRRFGAPRTMSLAQLASPSPRIEPRGNSLFRSSFDQLETRYEELWLGTDDTIPVLGDRVSRRTQRRNAGATERLLDELASEIEHYPEGEEERQLWRQTLKERLHRFGEHRLGWPQGYRDLLFADEFHRATSSFVRRARAFDPRIRVDSLTQALRNVWIMNSIQMLLERRVEPSPSIFAFSMLYPYTDNYLDDPGVGVEAKRDLNARLSRRLRGEPVDPADLRQARIFRLVEEIETQFPRSDFAEVFWSLEAIHRAQIESLTQQETLAPLTDRRILTISFAKGGASVLADAYLTAGTLTGGESDFFFGYGVFLQLLDDLQDIESDHGADHATLFTLQSERGTLDRLTGRLHRFMRKIVESSPRFAAPRFAQVKDLIFRNCTLLLVGAVAENPHLFSRRFRREVECRWPLSLRSMRKLRRVGGEKYRQSAAVLRQKRGVDSLLELL
jgi:hypothetical protein